MSRSVDVRQQRSPTRIWASAGAAVGLPTILHVSPQVPLRTVAIVAFGTFVLLLCVHFHKVLQIKSTLELQILACIRKLIQNKYSVTKI